tara:strand:+ start:390 stop:1259 length:870 start_codon:yes stop_codon:yes gene_type:complete
MAGIVALTSFIRPRLGLAIALVIPILPLGDVSTGLAIAYAAAAAIWLFLHWRKPHVGAVFVLGPILAIPGLLGLIAFGAAWVNGALRRSLLTIGCITAAIAFSGLQGKKLPFFGDTPPSGLGIARSEDPLAVITALANYAWSQPAFLFLGGIFAVISISAPLARQATLWKLSFASSFIVATTLLIPTLVFNLTIQWNEIVIAIALGATLLAGPALAAIRADAPPAKRNAIVHLKSVLLNTISLPRAGKNIQSSQQKVMQENPAIAGIGPIVTDPISLEEIWSQLAEAAD